MAGRIDDVAAAETEAYIEALRRATEGLESIASSTSSSEIVTLQARLKNAQNKYVRNILQASEGVTKATDALQVARQRQTSYNSSIASVSSVLNQSNVQLVKSIGQMLINHDRMMLKIRLTEAEIGITQKTISALETELSKIQETIQEKERLRALTVDEINQIQSHIAQNIADATTTSELLGRKRAEITATESLIGAANDRIESLRNSTHFATLERDATQSQLDAINDRVSAGEALSVSEEIARQDMISRIGQLNTLIEDNENQLTRENFGRLDLIRTLIGQTEEAQRLSEELLGLSHISEILNNELTDATGRFGDLNVEIDGLTAAQQGFTDQIDKNTKALQNQRARLKNEKLEAFTNILGKLSTILNQLVKPILEMQKQFGIAAGTAAKLQFTNLQASVRSYIDALTGTGPAVSAKEIEATQQAFRGEFGGILTSNAAKTLAQEAKRLGVSAGEMAKARRVFMTQTMGDVGKAKAAQDKFIGEFTKKGLTAKDAMAAIQQNSNLLARNGTRFAESFARAAADAKKIGVDLAKVDQVGDNIIGNYEGFLESQAELGAMGFGFDTSRLAELAESGDTGALMGELRSQLASTGKDITKLRRSEQLALSQAFGLSMEELQRMAGPTAGSGEETLSPEELQKDANGKLGKLVYAAEGIAAVLATVVTVLGVIAVNTAMNGLGGVSKLLPRAISSVPRAMATGRSLIRSPGFKVGGGALAGAFGAFGGYKTAKESGKGGYEAAGAGFVQGGLAAAGTALGAFGGPVGMMIGGFLGNTLGKAVNKFFPSFGANIGLLFKGFVSAFEPLKKMFVGMWQNIKKLGEPLSKLMSLFGGTTDKAGNLWPIMEKIGTVIGYVVQFALVPLTAAIRIFVTAASLAIGAVTAIAQLLTGDFAGAWKTVKDTLYNSFAWLVDPIMLAVNTIKGFFTGMINWIIDKVNILPGVDIPKIGGETTTGDDVVSKPGYGNRTLVTPTQTVALNNKDTVVAYADDLISNVGSMGLRMMGFGELADKADSTRKQAQSPAPVVNVDLSRLEAKLDAVVRAIGSMRVEMDGNRVGRVLVNNSNAAISVGVLRGTGT